MGIYYLEPSFYAQSLDHVKSTDLQWQGQLLNGMSGVWGPHLYLLLFFLKHHFQIVPWYPWLIDITLEKTLDSAFSAMSHHFLITHSSPQLTIVDTKCKLGAFLFIWQCQCAFLIQFWSQSQFGDSTHKLICPSSLKRLRDKEKTTEHFTELHLKSLILSSCLCLYHINSKNLVDI